MRKKHLYTFRNGSVRHHGVVQVSHDNYVNNRTPIEDYGDYLLTNKPCKDPFETWLNLQEQGKEAEEKNKQPN